MVRCSEVLHVVRVAERIPPLPGGKEIHVQELTRAQLKAGDDVHLIYRLGDAGEIPCQAHRVELRGWFGRWTGAITALFFSVAAAVRVLRADHEDVVHLHGDFLEVPALALAARLRRVPLVVTIHGGLNSRYVRVPAACFKWVDEFIALGATVADDLVARRVPRARIHVMSSGLNTELLDSVDSTAPPEPGRLVAVGTLDPVKNYEFLILCVIGLPDDVAVRLEILGDGPDRARLEEIAGGSPRVVFRGRLDRRGVYDTVGRAQLFVIASRSTGAKSEGVPTALLEAMYLRRHCLVSAQARPTPVVADSGAYDEFSVEDVRGLSDLILDAVRAPDRSLAVGGRARAAVEHLGWADVAARVRTVLVPSARLTA